MIFCDPHQEDGGARDDPCMRVRPLIAKREEEIQRRKKDRGRERRESCDELSTRTQRNHRLVRHPEDGSAYPQRPLAHACADAACANQPSIRLVVTEQEGSEIRSRPFGVRPSYDDELGAVEAFGLDPGRRGAGRGCRRSDLGCFLACGERHTGNVGGPTVRDRRNAA
jgi:hypothetical protein